MRWRPWGNLYQRSGKRAFDIAVTCAALPVAAPLMAVIAVLVRAALGRGVWYRQQRIGLHGKPFTVLKFRTMEADRRRTPAAEPASAQVDRDRRLTHKTIDDPRHTRFGQALRRTGLDELPQLLNILSGDMSLVGPRPELPQVVAGYAPWQHVRHEVRPGLTGLWQVSERGTVAMHESAEDVAYVRSVSLRGDLKLIARTIPALIRRAGA